MNTAIDFSILDALVNKQAATEPQDAPHAPLMPIEYKTIAEPQNALKTQANAPQGIYSKLERDERDKLEQREAAARQMEVYRAHQDAIKRGELLMSEITKGITGGIEPARLLLMALECISCQTGETRVFYEQNKQNLIAIHGAGLLEPAPLQMELDEVNKRLAMLTRPELDAEPEDSRERIRRAVKAHEARALLLEGRLQEARDNVPNLDTQDSEDTQAT